MSGSAVAAPTSSASSRPGSERQATAAAHAIASAMRVSFLTAHLPWTIAESARAKGGAGSGNGDPRRGALGEVIDLLTVRRIDVFTVSGVGEVQRSNLLRVEGHVGLRMLHNDDRDLAACGVVELDAPASAGVDPARIGTGCLSVRVDLDIHSGNRHVIHSHLHAQPLNRGSARRPSRSGLRATSSVE